MDHLSILAAILIVDFVALVSPGPNFVLITTAAVSKSRRDALWTAFGLAVGSLMWATAAAFGVAALLQALPLLGLAIKIVGCAYLLYLGIKLLRSKGFRPDGMSVLADRNSGRSFGVGLLVNLTNPKSAAYYAGVFAAFLEPGTPVWLLAAAVVAITLMSLAWHAGLAIGLSTAGLRAWYLRQSRLIDRFCGCVLIGLGLRLAWDRS